MILATLIALYVWNLEEKKNCSKESFVDDLDNSGFALCFDSLKRTSSKESLVSDSDNSGCTVCF